MLAALLLATQAVAPARIAQQAVAHGPAPHRGCDLIGRRGFLAAAATLPLAAGPALADTADSASVQELSAAELDGLDALSQRPLAGFVLPSGVRVIDLVVGSGPQPAKGSTVYCGFTVWSGGFRSGQAADLSFLDQRPYDWVLGTPTDRMPPGADLGAQGMREGGWRRLIIPAALAYGEKGLRKTGRRPAGLDGATEAYRSDRAGYAVKPNSDVYFDLRMLDGGSGRCDRLLRPPGMKLEDARKLRSPTCVTARRTTL